MVTKRGKYGPFFSCVRYPACRGACDPPGTPNRRNARGWRTPVIACLIGAAVVVAVVLFLKFQFAEREGGGQQAIRGEAKPPSPTTRSSMSLEEKRAYVSALKESEYPNCPRCANRMVIRNNASTGHPFFGCSQFPRCRGTRDVQFPK
jgi:ssDNA-binding Zn-finger/Zn-ribbon topoisomerase 1